MRVLMTGGGTGGHVNPALAIAETIKKNIPEAEIAFVGTKRGLENTLVPRAGYKLYHVDVRGFERKVFSIRNIRAAFLALVSPLFAKRIVKEFRPDIVIGTGGYVSWPVLVAASKLGVLTAVHESNAVPGLTVRKLVPYVDRIFTNFSVTASALGVNAEDKIMQVGCPVSSEIGKISKAEARKRLGIGPETKYYVVSFGGSLGARTLNNSALELMEKYVSIHPEVRYLHASGSGNYDEVADEFYLSGLDRCENIELTKYIYDMPLRIAAADLVICRSGAITCSELSRAHKASILIPSPNVTDNQQYKNAKVLSDCGGALLIEEDELEPGRIAKAVETLLTSPGMTDEMGKRVSTVSPADANERIFREICMMIYRRQMSEDGSDNNGADGKQTH